MVTGAYGQSLMHAAADKPAAAATPAATGGSADAVSRFLADKGLLVKAQAGGDGRLLDSVRDSASELVLSAMNFLGVRYTHGGNSIENGFDCSGFTRYIFEKSLGLVLPRRADEQARLSSLLPIKQTDLKPGDLVFFNTMRATFSHVGIYVGEGKFIHAPRTGAAIRVEDMRDAYWAKRFTGARRAVEADAAAPEQDAGVR
ncbi:MAG: C40 family peptidase [Pelomonas sp.]|nr:C40 family peptidase [Roseateles sp.]